MHTETEETDRKSETFLTPRQVMEERLESLESPRGRLLIASCRSGSALAAKVVARYEELLRTVGGKPGSGTSSLCFVEDIAFLKDVDFQFSDGETAVRLEGEVNGRDVFLFQALYDPTSGQGGAGGTAVDQNYMAFLIAVRAFREWGANHVTGILPYVTYARQDKLTKFKREPTTAKLMADLSIEAGLDCLVVWHPHSPQIHGFYGSVTVDAASSLALFTEEFHRFRGRDDVIAVAPDGGAAKYVMRFARTLDIASAVASKFRPRPEKAEIREVMGDFAAKRVAVVLDDMINTGGTIEATVTELVEEKGIEEVWLGISHSLCTERALERLSELHGRYHLRGMVTTNSIPQTEAFLGLDFLTVRSLADPLSRIINRIHHHRAVDGILAKPLPLVAEAT